MTKKGSIMFEASHSSMATQRLRNQIKFHKQSILGDWEPIREIKKYFYGETRWEKLFEKSINKLKNLKLDPYELVNNANLIYTYSIYVGSQKQKLNVVFDTGSDYLVVVGQDCTGCTEESKYDPMESTTYKEMSSDLINQQYGSANIHALKVEDDVFLDKYQTYGVEDFPFLMALYAEGLEGISGISGFSRNIMMTLSDGTKYIPGELYYHYLKRWGIINSAQFSIYLADYPTQSYIELGDSDFKLFSSDQQNKVKIYAEKIFFWSSFIDAIKIYVKLIKNIKKLVIGGDSWLLDDFPVIFDTGTSLIFTPYSIGIQIPEKALRNIYYENYEGIIVVDCDASYSKMESVSFMIGGYWFEIPPQTYILELEDMCIFGMVNGGAEYFVLGDVFYRNYYCNYNDDEGYMIYAPIKGGEIREISEGTKPESPMTGITQADLEIIYTVLGAIVTAVSVIIGLLVEYGIIPKVSSTTT